jgi:hypothetical protein
MESFGGAVITNYPASSSAQNTGALYKEAQFA